MKIRFIEPMFNSLDVECELSALPREGDHIEAKKDYFYVVDKVLFRLSDNDDKIIVFVKHK